MTKQSALLLLCLISAASAFAVPEQTTFVTQSRTSPLYSSIPAGGGTILAAPTAVPELKAPAAIYEGAVAAGTAKALNSFSKIFKLGVVSGCHIAFGMYLSCSVGGACPGLAATNPGLQKIVAGAFGLPFGLIMTLVTGGELFTGNTALVTAARLEGKVTTKDLIKNWTASYLGNFIGSLLLAFLVFKSGTLGAAPGAVNIATAKCAVAWDVAFVRGLLCNWLVCMAVYMASGCSSMIGKMTAVWFPISAFVALGLDHSIANMFIIPLGILRGAEITVSQMFLKNLIPVTLGNVVGGALCVMLPFGTTFGKWFQKK
jgi:formate/nitrite transporter